MKTDERKRGRRTQGDSNKDNFDEFYLPRWFSLHGFLGLLTRNIISNLLFLHILYESCYRQWIIHELFKIDNNNSNKLCATEVRLIPNGTEFRHVC